MEYGNIVSRSVNIVWQQKFLIALGFLASLGSGSSSTFSNSDGSGSGTGQPFGESYQIPDISEEVAALAVGAVVALVCVALIIGIVLWIVSSVARGGLIAAVDDIESGQKTSFTHAWTAGWSKLGTLLGIGFLPAIPGFIIFIGGLMAFGVYGGFAAFYEEQVVPGMAGLGIAIALLACIGVPIILALTILRHFAERACMLENLGVIDAYRRGWDVLTANLSEAVILFLLQIAIFVVLGIFLLVPGLILVLCCCLWPLLLVLQGAVSAVVSSIWTLAWRVWTGVPPLKEKSPDAS